jgi:hypothetical protein
MNGIQTISAEAYHARTELSASLAHLICSQSPLHAWTASRLNPNYKRVEESKFDIGTACHALLLEGNSGVALINAPDWRKKEARDERDAARAEGKLPILNKHWDDIRAMVAAAGPQLGALKIDPPLFKDGKPEQSLFWEEDGVQCRARLDWLRDDRAAIDDYKTTKGSANPAYWIDRVLCSIGADIQAAMYLRGLQAVAGSDPADVEWGTVPEFRFCVQEQTAPYALSVVSLDYAAMRLAHRKVDYALRTWKRCLAEDRWPGYSSQVCVAELPAWEETRWLEKETREEFDYGEDVPF